MAFIVGYLFYGLYTLVAVPDAPPALSPVIPGVKIPGVPFTFPLWYTLGALFFAIIVHEAMHGILSSAFNVKIKSSGFAFLGPIPGAFVEPDEDALKKRPKRQQLAMVAGGPFANVVLAAIAFLLFIGLASLGGKLLVTEGVTFQNVQEGSPAQIAGMVGNQTITAIDGVPITNLAELSATLDTKNVGENILVTADERQYRVTLEDNDGKAYMGVLAVTTKSRLKNPDMGWVYSGVLIISTLLLWTYVISLGVGIANLLPLFMVDGGRMALIALEHFFEEDLAKQIWTKGGFFILALVLILVFVPIGKAIFF
jgi:membrane-associated protease RseP (regulator of RpoE activity)